MVKRAIVLFIIAVLPSACVSTGGYQAAPTNLPDNPSYPDVFFDRDLSTLMKADQQEIEVSIVSNFTLDNIPPPMEKWLYMIDENKGVVKSEALPSETRGLIDIGIELALKAYDAIREKMMYSPCKKYNATVYFHPDSGYVKNIVFTHK